MCESEAISWQSPSHQVHADASTACNGSFHISNDCVTVMVQEQEKVRWQEQRKSMQEDAKMKAELAQYQDQLARKRSGDEHEKNRERNAELVRMQEQSTARQEQQRAQTEAQIQAERRASEKYKVLACNILLCHTDMLNAWICLQLCRGQDNDTWPLSINCDVMCLHA